MRKVNESEVEWIIRGGAGLSAPENTIAALDVGQSLGVRHVWLDLQISRDGVPFFLRDKRLERTTNTRGIAHALDWQRLKKLDAAEGHPFRVGAEKIPVLQDVLDWLRTQDTRLTIELRATANAMSSLVDSLVQTCQRFPDVQDKLHIACGSLGALARCGETLKIPQRHLIVDRPKRPIFYEAQALGLEGVCAGNSVWTERHVKYACQFGLMPSAFGVRHVSDARRLIDAGVQRLCIEDLAIMERYESTID
jgi:glycerophosphoryl diester phosphodiesterase